MVIVKIKKLSEEALVPQFAHYGDACADLYSTEEMIIRHAQVVLVPTGIAIELPIGWEAQIRPRSGLSYKHQLLLLNTPGTIDSGYRGEIKIIMKNLSNKNYFIGIGDKIAQMAIRPVPDIIFEVAEQLQTSIRGEGGFGSTGY